jgi:hypothetical protein
MLNPQYDPICNIGITPIMPPIIVPSAYTPVYASGTAMTSFVFFVAFGTTLFSILPTRAVNSAGRHESGHQLFAPHASTCTLEDLKDATQRCRMQLVFLLQQLEMPGTTVVSCALQVLTPPAV